MRKNKIITVFIVLGLLLTGCGTQKPEQQSPQPERERESRVEIQEEGQVSPDPASEKENHGLRLLCKDSWNCMAEDGYYYITEDSKELKRGLWGRHIMYMDFATKQEVYLCAEPGCKHIDEKCSAVLSDTDINVLDYMIFVMNDRLYIVEKESDDEGTMESHISEEDVLGERERMPVVIYSMGLDGSGRKKEYTFDRDMMVETKVLGDGENLYFVTKKLTTSSKKAAKYTTATERKLVKFRVKDSGLETVCPLSSEKDIRWGILGASGENIILQGTKYNGNLTPEEIMALGDDESWKYENDSKEIIMALNVRDGKTSEVYSMDNNPDSLCCIAMWDDFLYVSREKEKIIEKIDIKTGKVKKLVELEHGLWIDGCLDGFLHCSSCEDSEDYTTYFVDMDSGKVQRSKLVNKCNGWRIEIIGEWKEKVLAIYDYDGTEAEEGAWDIKRNQFGLIDKEKLLKGTDAFEKIEMKGTGM